MGITLNTEYAMKGVISALILMIAPIIGVFLRLGGASGYLIGVLVAVLNIAALIGIGWYLKNNFLPDEENLEESDKAQKSGKKEKISS